MELRQEFMPFAAFLRRDLLPIARGSTGGAVLAVFAIIPLYITLVSFTPELFYQSVNFFIGSVIAIAAFCAMTVLPALGAVVATGEHRNNTLVFLGMLPARLIWIVLARILALGVLFAIHVIVLLPALVAFAPFSSMSMQGTLISLCLATGLGTANAAVGMALGHAIKSPANALFAAIVLCAALEFLLIPAGLYGFFPADWQGFYVLGIISDSLERMPFSTIAWHAFLAGIIQIILTFFVAWLLATAFLHRALCAGRHLHLRKLGAARPRNGIRDRSNPVFIKLVRSQRYDIAIPSPMRALTSFVLFLIIGAGCMAVAAIAITIPETLIAYYILIAAIMPLLVPAAVSSAAVRERSAIPSDCLAMTLLSPKEIASGHIRAATLGALKLQAALLTGAWFALLVLFRAPPAIAEGWLVILFLTALIPLFTTLACGAGLSSTGSVGAVIIAYVQIGLFAFLIVLTLFMAVPVVHALHLSSDAEAMAYGSLLLACYCGAYFLALVLARNACIPVNDLDYT